MKDRMYERQYLKEFMEERIYERMNSIEFGKKEFIEFVEDRISQAIIFCKPPKS